VGCNRSDEPPLQDICLYEIGFERDLVVLEAARKTVLRNSYMSWNVDVTIAWKACKIDAEN
jgi:hypothetical protein